MGFARCSFTCLISSSRSQWSILFCLTLHISNIHTKNKGIAQNLILTLRAIMISQEVDLVAGDFNGTDWRCRSRDSVSTIEVFADCALHTPPGHPPLWWPVSIPNVKVIYPAPDIHEHFTIHKWLQKTAYIFTHNFNNLEHIATNCMINTMHTDANTAQFWARRAPSVDALHICVHTSHVAQVSSVCLHFHPWSSTCALVLECCLLLCVSLLRPQVLLPPLPESCHGAWREFHGRSPVQPQLREHCQPGLCHTRHRVWAQGHGARRHQWAEPRDLQRYLLPERPRRHGFLPQRSWRRRQWACRIPCSCGRWNRAICWGEKQQWSIFLWHPKLEKCSESVSFSHSTQKNDQSNWGGLLKKGSLRSVKALMHRLGQC